MARALSEDLRSRVLKAANEGAAARQAAARSLRPSAIRLEGIVLRQRRVETGAIGSASATAPSPSRASLSLLSVRSTPTPGGTRARTHFTAASIPRRRSSRVRQA